MLSDVDGETSDSRGSVKQHVDRPRVTSTPRHTHLSVLVCLATVSDSALHLLAPQRQQKKAREEERKEEKRHREGHTRVETTDACPTAQQLKMRENEKRRENETGRKQKYKETREGRKDPTERENEITPAIEETEP